MIFSGDDSLEFWRAVNGEIKDSDVRHDILYTYGCRAQEMETKLTKLEAASDFRAHTCGECAWVKLTDFANQPDKGFVCRHRSSDLIWPIDVPACPAFVPRELQP